MGSSEKCQAGAERGQFTRFAVTKRRRSAYGATNFSGSSLQQPPKGHSQEGAAQRQAVFVDGMTDLRRQMPLHGGPRAAERRRRAEQELDRNHLIGIAVQQQDRRRLAAM